MIAGLVFARQQWPLTRRWRDWGSDDRRGNGGRCRGSCGRRRSGPPSRCCSGATRCCRPRASPCCRLATQQGLKAAAQPGGAGVARVDGEHLMQCRKRGAWVARTGERRGPQGKRLGTDASVRQVEESCGRSAAGVGDNDAASLACRHLPVP